MTDAPHQPPAPPDRAAHHLAIVAFGCQPDSSSEHRTGWQWVSGLAAAGQRLSVFTDARNRPAIEGADLPADQVHFEWIDPQPPWWRSFSGGFRIAGEYIDFLQRCGPALARRHAADPFDAGIHVSWTNIRLGTPLTELDLPVVFGPVGGGQVMPVRATLATLGRSAPIELARSAHVALTRVHPAARRSARRAALTLVTNRETARLARHLGARRVEEFTDLGIDDTDIDPRPLPPTDGPVRLLWVGRLMPRKAVGLAVDAVARAAADVDVTLTIAGDGEDARRLTDLPDQVTWLGQVPVTDLPDLFGHHHALLYTSLRDSSCPPILEALGYGRPVICFDQHGPGLLADDRFALVADPRGGRLADHLADQIRRLGRDPDLLERLAAGTADARADHRQPARVDWLLDRIDELVGPVGTRPDR